MAKAGFQTMQYLIVAIAIGTVAAVITDAIEQMRWMSVLLGLLAGAVTFDLGAPELHRQSGAALRDVHGAE